MVYPRPCDPNEADPSNVGPARGGGDLCRHGWAAKYDHRGCQWTCPVLLFPDTPVYLFGWAAEISSTRRGQTSSPSSPWTEFSLCSSCRRRRCPLLPERSTAQEVREQLYQFQWDRDRNLAAPIERRRISSGELYGYRHPDLIWE